MFAAEHIGWATVGAILLVQLLQQLVLDFKAQKQNEAVGMIKEQQDLVVERVHSLENSIKDLQHELAGYAMTSQILALEVSNLSSEISKMSTLVFSSTEKRG